MSFVAIAIGGSALIGLGGAALSANAANNAADKQQQSAGNALDFQKQAYNTQMQNAQPYLEAGKSALSTLQSDMPSLTQGFDPTKAGLPAQFSYGAKDFTQDPGYQFALQQGQQAIERSAAARGGDVSGGALKSLDQYTTGMASQEYGNAYQRALGTYQQNYSNAENTFYNNENNTFNKLGSLVNSGLSANNQAAGAGQNFANNASQIAIGAGNAAAAGIVGSSNAINQGISGVAGSLTNSVMLNQLLGQNATNNTASGYNNTFSVGNNMTSMSNLGTSPYTGGYTDQSGNWVATQ